MCAYIAILYCTFVIFVMSNSCYYLLLSLSPLPGDTVEPNVAQDWPSRLPDNTAWKQQM